MKRPLLAILIIHAVIVAACVPGGLSIESSPVPRTVTPPVPTEFVATAIPFTPTFAGCAYIWGSQDMPELSRLLNMKLQNLGKNPTGLAYVSGLAYAYGENCVYADGHQTFSAQETDFRIGVQVTTIRDDGTMGEWMYKVMQVVVALPQEQLHGPQPGRVDFDFKQQAPGDLFVTVPIDRYRREAGNLHGIPLFKLFYSAP